MKKEGQTHNGTEIAPLEKPKLCHAVGHEFVFSFFCLNLPSEFSDFPSSSSSPPSIHPSLPPSRRTNTACLC